MPAARIAWAAGLFDGEGAVSLQDGWLHLQLKMCDRAAVERFADTVAAGRVGGPYKNRSGEIDGYPRRDFYVWYTRRGEAIRVLRSLWPYLTDTRKDRALELGFSPPSENT